MYVCFNTYETNAVPQIVRLSHVAEIKLQCWHLKLIKYRKLFCKVPVLKLCDFHRTSDY